MKPGSLEHRVVQQGWRTLDLRRQIVDPIADLREAIKDLADRTDRLSIKVDEASTRIGELERRV